MMLMKVQARLLQQGHRSYPFPWWFALGYCVGECHITHSHTHSQTQHSHTHVSMIVNILCTVEVLISSNMFMECDNSRTSASVSEYESSCRQTGWSCLYLGTKRFCRIFLNVSTHTMKWKWWKWESKFIHPKGSLRHLLRTRLYGILWYMRWGNNIPSISCEWIIFPVTFFNTCTSPQEPEWKNTRYLKQNWFVKPFRQASSLNHSAKSVYEAL